MACLNIWTLAVILAIGLVTSQGPPRMKPIKPKKPGVTCGRVPHLNVVPRFIVGNETVVPYGQLPWHVGLFYQPDNTFLCSGTLVSTQHVLTSAFCLFTIEADSRVEIRLGDWDIKSNLPTFLEPYPHLSAFISKTTLYPESSPLDTEMKVPIIALLRLTEPVDFLSYPQVAPICLPSKIKDKLKLKPKQFIKEDTANDKCFVSGWGLQTPDSASSQPPPEVTKRTVSDDDGPFLNQKYEYNADSMSKASVDSIVPLKSNTKPSEPFSISVPILPSPYQQALYYGSGSGEVFGRGEFRPIQMEGVTRMEGITLTGPGSMPQSTKVVEDAPPQIRKAKNPDPIDEYVDEEVENLANSADELSTLMDSIFDKVASKETVIDNSTIYTSTSSHETSRVTMTAEQKALQDSQIATVEAKMNRHKQKYNIGKKQAAMIRAKQESETVAQYQRINEENHGMRKREVNGAVDPASFSTTEKPIPPISSSILKWVGVKIEEKCSTIPDYGLNMSPVGKSCLAATHKDMNPSFCLVDLGSPITCISNGQSDQSSLEGIVSNEKKTRERAYLGGLVTWKRPCFADDQDPSVNVSLVANTNKFLTFLRKNIRDI